MFRILKLKRMSNEQFVRLIVKEAREDYRKSLEEKWPETVPSLGIPYGRYEWERLMQNMYLLMNYANQMNLNVEIMKGHVSERYLKYSYIYYENLDVD